MIIKTNNHWRDPIYGYDLTESERAEFDYLDPDDIDCHSFARYRNWVYDLSEFSACWHDPREPETNHCNQLKGWQGYQSDSFFSGICIRWDRSCDQYQIGTYLT